MLLTIPKVSHKTISGVVKVYPTMKNLIEAFKVTHFVLTKVAHLLECFLYFGDGDEASVNIKVTVNSVL